ncbi:MAG: dihydrolipoyllysine-residue acetyltransferase [Pseudomonadota bacterium]
MTEQNIVKVPDIGDFENVEVVEVLVAQGDQVSAEQSLISLESDKATMEIPSPADGVVAELLVAVGDRISEGDAILALGASEAASPAPAEPDPVAEAAPAAEAVALSAPAEAPAQPTAAASAEPVQVIVPDIGDFDAVDVVEVLVAVGDEVAQEQSLISLESDKATMEVPSSEAGTVLEVHVAVGEQVGQGAPVVTLQPVGAAAAPAPATPAPTPEAPAAPAPAAAAAPSGKPESDAGSRREPPMAFDASTQKPGAVPHASPSVRREARELGVDLTEVTGTGRKGRITTEDVRQFVKAVMQRKGSGTSETAGGAGLSLLPWPKVDFSQFGPVESQPLSRIQKISGANLARNWAMIPHVTQHDEADVTDMEGFRKGQGEAAKAAGVKLTPLAFLIKAVVAALKQFPQFNASLEESGETLILKQYFHIGVAVDTPDGLVVPVIRDCDQKSLFQLAGEVVEASVRARDKKLSPKDLQGGCFSISSLGGIGGTSFTPIINAPEVAILGVSRSRQQPVWDGSQFAPRLMLPLSLSYDHRVIDGATAARFTRYLADMLTDIRRLLL